MSRVELYERIRRDNRVEGLSVRELSRRHRVHRRTVRLALASAVPPARKVPERVSPVLGPWEEIARAWLVADRDLPVKQRHTARRVWRRLRDEYDAIVAESTVRAFVAKVNFELDSQLGSVTVPQSHGPGEEAECDFGEFYAYVAGVQVKLWMFCLRLSHSGDGFHMAFSHQAQEAFLEGHVAGFASLGGVPVRVRYDNLRPAVAKVLLGRDRTETERFIALRSHYLLTELLPIKIQVRGYLGYPRFGSWALIDRSHHDRRAGTFERSSCSRSAPGRSPRRYRGSLGALPGRWPGRGRGRGGVGLVR